jgi:hypothetical protein
MNEHQEDPIVDPDARSEQKIAVAVELELDAGNTISTQLDEVVNH